MPAPVCRREKRCPSVSTKKQQELESWKGTNKLQYYPFPRHASEVEARRLEHGNGIVGYAGDRAFPSHCNGGSDVPTSGHLPRIEKSSLGLRTAQSRSYVHTFRPNPKVSSTQTQGIHLKP